jgi:threonine dehydrogenase-like Zn-dependent dehydrogenase
MPSILGHELCGTISSSSNTSKFKPGDKVMIDPRLTCHSLAPHGPCVPCTSGRDHQCPKLGFTGYSGTGGGFAEFVPVEERMLYAIPENVPLEVAALIEPLTVAHHAVKMTGFQGYADKSVLIVGGGPVGYAVILALRAAGCKKIVVSEPTKRRREEVERLVEKVVDPRSEDVGKACRSVTEERGVDACFDCAGVQKGFEAGIDALTLGGWWVNVSLWENKVSLPF